MFDIDPGLQNKSPEFYKMLHVINGYRTPNSYSIDYDALEALDLGQGHEMTPVELLEMLEQRGIAIKK